MTREQFITRIECIQEELRRFLTALCCGNSALADDIAQEACIKAYLSSDSLKSPDKFKPWIFRIGYTSFINHKRSQKSFAGYDEALHIAADSATDSAFRYQALYAALGRLPDKERTSVLLFYMEGYAIKEIAEIQETTESAVKQHLMRGRIHLRGLLTQTS